MKRVLFYIVLFVAGVAGAQTEVPVGVPDGPVVADSVAGAPVAPHYASHGLRPYLTGFRPYFTLLPLRANAYVTTASYSVYTPFRPGRASVFAWRGGGITATGGEADMPGLMHIASGGFGVNQRFGAFDVYAGGVVNKYGFFNGLLTQYGVTGSLTYNFSPRLSVTAFGTYYFGGLPSPGGLPVPPSMLGYYGRSAFGGYVDYKVSDSFGVHVGAQAVRNAGAANYHVEPIATPYVKVGKVGIGLPVGEIVYGIIENAVRR